MARRKRKLKRIEKIKRAAAFILCAALVVTLSIYIYHPDLLFAQAGPDPADPESDESSPPAKEPEPDPKPLPRPPGLEENPQLDAPEPDGGDVDPRPDAPDPEKSPSVPPPAPLEPVDGSDLFALVTKQTTLGRFAPTDLEQIPAKIVHPDRRGGNYYLRREPLEYLKEMWTAAGEEGVRLTVTSAYRSYDTQVRLFSDYAGKYGEKKANTFSARAGQSEHQLGTTLDFNTDTAAGAEQHAWLAENAHNFGFAMSYSEGTQDITGYKYEPWHYRYIGVEAATEWKESGLPLCLYLEQKQ